MIDEFDIQIFQHKTPVIPLTWFHLRTKARLIVNANSTAPGTSVVTQISPPSITVNLTKDGCLKEEASRQLKLGPLYSMATNGWKTSPAPTER